MKSIFSIYIIWLFGSTISVNAQSFTYDLCGHLTCAVYSNGMQVGYTYDAAGNVSTIAINSVVPLTNSPILIISSLSAATNSHNAPYTLSLTWGSVPGANYQVLTSTNLASTNWLVLRSPVLATNNTTAVSDVIGTNQQQFYRVSLLPN